MNINNFGVGVDTEDIKRFEKYAQDKTHGFLKRVYTDKELEYCFSNNFPAKHLAVRFCAKEAVYKAFCSVGVESLSYKEIEISNYMNKVPFVILNTEKTKGFECKLSLSHSKDNAVASVIILKS